MQHVEHGLASSTCNNGVNVIGLSYIGPDDVGESYIG